MGDDAVFIESRSVDKYVNHITDDDAVDVVVVCPMQAEDARLLEPRICQLHPIPFS